MLREPGCSSKKEIAQHFKFLAASIHCPGHLEIRDGHPEEDPSRLQDSVAFGKKAACLGGSQKLLKEM